MEVKILNKFEEYEIEKQKIQAKNLSAKEYEMAIRELCKKLKI